MGLKSILSTDEEKIKKQKNWKSCSGYNIESQEIENVQEKLRDMEDWIKKSNIKLIEVSEGNNGENRE